MDVVELRDFYASRLGLASRRLIAHRLRRRWSSLGGATVMGLGFATPTPSWGAMLGDVAAVQVAAESPWLLAPAAAIVIAVFVVHTAGTSRDPLLWGRRDI